MVEYLIRLPWPPKQTSANAANQGNYLGKARAAKAYKRDCATLCMAQGVRKMGGDLLEVEVIFCPPKNVGRFDLDNTLGRCKQGLDAVSEAIGVDDGLWQRMVLSRGQKSKDGAVLVHVKPMAVLPVTGTIS